MHGKYISSGHVVVHHTEDTLLHLTSIRSTKNNQLLLGKINIYGSLTVDLINLVISDKLTSVHDSEVRASVSKIMVDFLFFSSHKHLLHEKSVVRSARDNTNLHSVCRVPTSISINNKDSSSHIKEINSPLSIAVVDISTHGNVDRTPVDGLFSFFILHYSLIFRNSTSFTSGTNRQSTSLSYSSSADSWIG